jgi:hypothetical protein
LPSGVKKLNTDDGKLGKSSGQKQEVGTKLMKGTTVSAQAYGYSFVNGQSPVTGR